MKPHIYISGPMSGMPDLNFPAFNEAAKALRAAGYTVTNPAELDAQDAGKVMTWEKYMRRDIVALMACDGVALLPGWTESRGATLEAEIAGRLGMTLWSVPMWLKQSETRAARSAAAR